MRPVARKIKGVNRQTDRHYNYNTSRLPIGKNGRMMTLGVKIPNRGKVHLVNIYVISNGRLKCDFYEEIDIQVNFNFPIIMGETLIV